jgi:hypothetical protein
MGDSCATGEQSGANDERRRVGHGGWVKNKENLRCGADLPLHVGAGEVSNGCRYINVARSGRLPRALPVRNAIARHIAV